MNILVLTRHRPNDATDVFFLGIGEAFAGLTSLLINIGEFDLGSLSAKIDEAMFLTCLGLERVYSRVSGVISLVADNPVRSVASNTNAWLSKWYKDVSSPIYSTDEAKRKECS